MKQSAKNANAIAALAKELSSEAKVFCFDEFQVCHVCCDCRNVGYEHCGCHVIKRVYGRISKPRRLHDHHKQPTS